MVAARELLTLCLERGISYASMAEKLEINQFYLWSIVNEPDYVPPLWVRKRLGDKAPEIERRIRSGGPFVVALVTAHPLGIMTLFHWASGFSSMRLVPFAIAVGVGAIIRAFSLSLFGATLREVGSAKFWIASAILAAVAIISLAHPGLRRCILKG